MGTRLPAKLWLNEVEDSCMSQIMDLTSLPFAFKHIAIMPDAHAGKGMPIGGVLATKGVIVPNAVGVDIGCGMCAIKTNRKAEDFSYTDLTSHILTLRTAGSAYLHSFSVYCFISMSSTRRFSSMSSTKCTFPRQITLRDFML